MRLGEKYYAAIEAGNARINLVRLIQFICIMQISADDLLMGSHPDYPTKYDYREMKNEERKQLDKLLDQCSSEDLQALCIIVKRFQNQ